MQILCYLGEIPAVLWSALLGSVLTLVGVMISNRNNTKRLVMQLSHDSEEKGKDRIDSLRKSVYLKAAEEMSKASSYLGKIPHLDPAKENVGDALSEFFSVAAKLQLVSQPNTALLADELATRYGEILLGLLAKASPVHNINTDIRIRGEIYDKNQIEINRVLAEMSQLNESGQPDQVRFTALKLSYESAQETAIRLAEEQSKSYEQQSTATREYNIALLNEIRSVGILQMQLTAAIRSELGLETDIDTAEYEARLRVNVERMDRSLRGLLAKLEGG